MGNECPLSMTPRGQQQAANGGGASDDGGMILVVFGLPTSLGSWLGFDLGLPIGSMIIHHSGEFSPCLS